jgi:acetate kinase
MFPESSLSFLRMHQVAVFDTAFHMTVPKEAYMYAIPHECYEKYHIRSYGFHGTSYKYITQAAAMYLNKPVEETNLIICHLGNGASMCAVKGGKSVETSMGLTPLEGKSKTFWFTAIKNV